MLRIADDDRAADEIGVFEHQIDGLLLGQLARSEVALFVGGAAPVEEILDARLVDQPLEQLARRRFFGQIVFVQIDAVLLEVGDRLPAAGSTRLEIDVDFFLHRLRIKRVKNERIGFRKIGPAFRAAERGSRSGGSFLESEKWRSAAGRGMRGLLTTSGGMISLEF